MLLINIIGDDMGKYASNQDYEILESITHIKGGGGES
jgi:hypothetical protein